MIIGELGLDELINTECSGQCMDHTYHRLSFDINLPLTDSQEYSGRLL